MKLYPSTTVIINSGGGGTGLVTWGPNFGTPGGDSLPQVQSIALPAIGLSMDLPQIQAIRNTNIGLSTGVAQIQAIALQLGIVSGVAQRQAISMSLGLLTGVAQTQAIANPAIGLLPQVAQAHTLGAKILAGPFYQTVGVGASAGAGTSAVITKPSGTVEGDFMLAFIMTNTIGAITAPADWTFIRSDIQNGTLDAQVSSYYRFAGASEGTNYTWTVASGAWFGSIHRLTGVDTSSPINGSTGGVANVADPIVPTLSTTVINCMDFIVCAQASATDVTYTQPATYTERTDQNGASTAGAHVLDGSTAQRIQAAIAATGTSTINSSTLVAVDSAYQRVLIAPAEIVIA